MYNQTNELKHYGVLGMKWGVRRYQDYDGELDDDELDDDDLGSIRKHYLKATKKETKLTKKVNKLENKYNKLSNKYEKAVTKMRKRTDENGETDPKLSSKVEKLKNKTDKVKSKYDSKRDKLDSWISSMDDTFMKISVNSIPKSKQQSGESYVEYIIGLNEKTNAIARAVEAQQAALEAQSYAAMLQTARRR